MYTQEAARPGHDPARTTRNISPPATDDGRVVTAAGGYASATSAPNSPKSRDWQMAPT